MSSETKFKCNFCNCEIVNLSSNSDFQGYTILNGRKVTTDLYTRITGPHICSRCVTAIFKDTEFSEDKS